jgi:signal peptidase I
VAQVATPTFRKPAERTRFAPPGKLRLRGRVRRIAGAAATIALLAAAWWFLAPPAIGGSTSFTSVDGISMLPKLHSSDLVALRPADTYRVGDIVGYRSPLIHRVVLHRIVAIHGKHYVFKGDNNHFTDPDSPVRKQLVGKLWFRVPQGGRAVAWLHVPWILAAIASVFVLVIGLGGRPQRKPEGAPH